MVINSIFCNTIANSFCEPNVSTTIRQSSSVAVTVEMLFLYPCNYAILNYFYISTITSHRTS